MTSLYENKYYHNPYKVKIAAYYFRNWDSYRMQFHSHERVEIMYVTKGKCSIDVKKDNFVLSSGDMILIDSGVSHRIIMAEGEQCRMMNIEFLYEPNGNSFCIGMAVGEEFLNSKLMRDKKECIVFKNGLELYPYLSTVLRELSGECNESVLQLQAAQILIKTAKLYENLNSFKRAKAAVYVNKAIDYINKNYHEKIVAEDIAYESGVNKNYLQRKFREYTGQTIANHINQIRIEKAKQLLESTDIPIVDLCLYVGINSRQYFTSLFTKHTGISPQKYRQNFMNSSWEKSHDS
jgi:AraC-like DNA-binding protein